MSEPPTTDLEEAAPIVEVDAQEGALPKESQLILPNRLDRRLLLKGLGAGLAGISLAPLLAACSSSNNGGASIKAPVGAAPAGGTPVINVSKGASLKILVWNHFVPAYDTFFDQFAADWGKSNGVSVGVDHVDIAQLPGRLAAEAAARKGHDLFAFEAQIQTRRYEKRLVDLTDLMNGLIKQLGEPSAMAKSVALVNGKWLGVPSFNVLIAPLVRRDLLQQLNLKAPESWNDVLTVGKQMKAAGHPAGMAISHCNDSNHNWRAAMWSFGASEVQSDGKTLALDTPEMKDFLGWAKQFQAEANSDEVYAWGDVSDNQYLGSGTGYFIHDAISSLISLQGKNDALYNNIDILPILKGPKRQVQNPDPQVWAMWDSTPKANLEAATAFVWHFMNSFQQTFKASGGYNMPMFSKLLQKPMPVLSEDPKFNVLQDFQGDILQTFGFPGPPTPAAEEVLVQFIVPDMVAKVRNGSVADAIKWATDQIKPIYQKHTSSLTPVAATPSP
jgi:multiple sugar transport system substrate-binding protein